MNIAPKTAKAYLDIAIPVLPFVSQSFCPAWPSGRITVYVIRNFCYPRVTVIVSYRDKATERFASGRHVKEFSGFARQAEMRLDRLETATSLPDLAALPGNRLEALRGDRAGQFSIRINDQWRICFRWPEGSPGPVDVEIVDYH